ncbi:primosomal protein N' [Thalassotalea atypica]|uniref:primosomal protein N' n=1 Tax=Thalassotalea atypica TaxID=2054316 RepID=UPI0025738197|nr:primosomal protein N' [Thalassotalea atypica]
MTQRFLQVAIPVPLRQIFTYRLPDSLTNQSVIIGERVLVPFGHRQVVGVVLGVVEENDTALCNLDENKIKDVISRLQDQYHFDASLMTFLRTCAQYYHHPIGEVIQLALPVLFRQIEQPDLSFEKLWVSTAVDHEEALKQFSKSAHKQKALLALIHHHQGISWSELRTLGYAKTQLNALEKKSLIEEQELIPAPFIWHDDHLQASNKLQLSVEQAVVVSAMTSNLDKFSCHLVDGITGSGKTEVYLQVMEQVLANSQQVLVMVPEIGLTPQTLARFEDRFNVPIFLHHSGLNDKERLDTWRAAHRGHAAIIIGTRSAIFTPTPKLGLIIVDEEHDSSLKQQDSFRYHGRDIAILRARQLNIPIVLGSATPSFESLQNALSEKYHFHQLTKRPGNSRPATLKLINVYQQQMEHGISGTVKKAIEQTLAKDEQVLVFLNRRGFAPAINCKECHHVVECLRCNKPYTFHQNNQLLVCHHCGSQKRMMKQCGQCGSIRLQAIGQGTEQIEQHLNEWFPKYSAVRIDRDSTRRKGALAKVIQEIHDKQHHLLIGTQMLAKGHHFPDVTLVVILDVDGALFSFDFRAAEQMAQLLVQVSGRAGRASKPGQVLIQTQYPDHPLLQDLVNNGYPHFAQQALDERKYAKLPPFGYQALIRAEANYPSYPSGFLRELSQLDLLNCELAGPIPAAMEKKAGKYRYHLIVQSVSRKHLHQAILHILTIAPQIETAKKVRWTIDVDPIDFSW